MANLTESELWSAGVTQIEAEDFVQGASDAGPGIDNQPHIDLANRTLWLRSRLNAQTQVMDVIDNAGDRSRMVWVPRFRVAAGSLGTGRPSRDLRLGGFLVDQCHAQLLSGTKAVSSPGSLPAVSLTPTLATSASIAREVGTRTAHLLTQAEWGHLAWLVEVLGHELHGNLLQGRDPRDPDAWEYFGTPGRPDIAVAGATGPLSWAHNGLASGVWDLLGNAGHMLGGFAYNLGCLEVRYLGTLAQAIDDADTDFVIEDAAGLYPPALGFERWEEENGLLYLSTFVEGQGFLIERMVYQERVAVSGHPEQNTFVSCQRGAYGSTPRAWGQGQVVWCMKHHCIVPGGYAGYVLNSGLDNTTPGQATFQYGMKWLTHGTRDGVPTAGQVLCCESEDLLIDVVAGDQITVTRGHNGTTIAAHALGAGVVAYPPASKMTRTQQGTVNGFATGAIRTHADLEELYIPADTYPTAGPNQPGPDRRMLMDLKSGIAVRGELMIYASPTDLMALSVVPEAQCESEYIGFRTALTLADVEYGGA